MKTAFICAFLFMASNAADYAPFKFNGCFSLTRNNESVETSEIVFRDKMCKNVTEENCRDDFDSATRSKVELLIFECQSPAVPVVVESETFEKFPNVKTVDFSSLEAPSLNIVLNKRNRDGEFQGYNVTTLNGSKNRIRHVPQSLFVLMPYIREIDFSHNQFQILTTNCFKGARQLTHINFANNHLANLEPGVFEKLNQLKSLDLSGNELKSVDAGAFWSGDST